MQNQARLQKGFWHIDVCCLTKGLFFACVKNKELRMSDAELDKVIRDLLNIQEDRCAITGLPLQFRGEQTDDNMLPSLDRIDSNGHYSRDNLQIVCRFINFWKQASDDAEFRRLIGLVRGMEQSEGN